MAHTASDGSPPPFVHVMSLGTAFWKSQALYAAAFLGVADHLASGPLSATELASRIEANPRALHRLLRALASEGIFVEQEQGRFAQTPSSDLLRRDHPATLRPAILMAGEEHYRAWGDFLYSVQTEAPAFDRVLGQPLFDFLSSHPEQAALFDQAMTSIHGGETAAVVEAYDFSTLGTVVDVGGGNGSTLMGILHSVPSLRGLLYDLPHVVERARQPLVAAGLAERCTLVGGSFFESLPSGGDAYHLRHIIHDWSDEKSQLILRNCRKAMAPQAKLLLVESVIPRGNEPSFAKWLDLNMMAIPGGLERTEEEYRALFEATGFRLTRIVPTKAGVSVIEGTPL